MLMVPFKERYVIDENGNRVAVMLAMEDYQKLLEELDLLESIRAYDVAKASGDEAIPFEEAIAEIERSKGSRRKFERALSKVREIEPESHDVL
jgi:PHD/YefM family antitoxin component YafN of YafNO toxin-antitoxin module